MAASRAECAGAEQRPLLRCARGEKAVLEVSLFNGTRYFCEAHQADGERMLNAEGR